jgi:5-methyltetrahydrofolate corrinoid/iron sulfur protein methyltransferase
MLVIGERINGMFKDVAKAIQEKDGEVIQNLARAQLAGGAGALDVNTGAAAADPAPAMQWLVETIRGVTDAPLAIDTTKPPVMEAGLNAAGPGSIMNSTTGQQDRLSVLMPMAKTYSASIICLTIDEKGVPRDAAGRAEIALRIVSAAMENGIDMPNVYIDPVVLPANVAQPAVNEVLASIRDIRLLSDPPPKTVVGLSNISQGTMYRRLINRTFLVMATAVGLDAAILDPLDSDMMDAMITAELLMNKNVYCDDYLKAYRASSGG